MCQIATIFGSKFMAPRDLRDDAPRSSEDLDMVNLRFFHHSCPTIPPLPSSTSQPWTLGIGQRGATYFQRCPTFVKGKINFVKETFAQDKTEN